MEIFGQTLSIQLFGFIGFILYPQRGNLNLLQIRISQHIQLILSRRMARDHLLTIYEALIFDKLNDNWHF